VYSQDNSFINENFNNVKSIINISADVTNDIKRANYKINAVKLDEPTIFFPEEKNN